MAWNAPCQARTAPMAINSIITDRLITAIESGEVLEPAWMSGVKGSYSPSKTDIRVPTQAVTQHLSKYAYSFYNKYAIHMTEHTDEMYAQLKSNSKVAKMRTGAHTPRSKPHKFTKAASKPKSNSKVAKMKKRAPPPRSKPHKLTEAASKLKTEVKEPKRARSDSPQLSDAKRRKTESPSTERRSPEARSPVVKPEVRISATPPQPSTSTSGRSTPSDDVTEFGKVINQGDQSVKKKSKAMKMVAHVSPVASDTIALEPEVDDALEPPTRGSQHKSK